MTDKERLTKILTASPELLASIDAVIGGDAPSPAPRPMRMFRLSEAAKETHVSRATIFRAVKDGRLATIEVRKNSRRIPESALRVWAGA
jgi:excisionase family DNA binding protein